MEQGWSKIEGSTFDNLGIICEFEIDLNREGLWVFFCPKHAGLYLQAMQLTTYTYILTGVKPTQRGWLLALSSLFI